MRCVCGCGRLAVQLHHVVTQQVLRREAKTQGLNFRKLAEDHRNMAGVTLEDHAAHHSRQRPLRLDALPDCAFTFAREVLGAGPAFNLLRRNYAGEDPRLEALLDDRLEAA